MSSVIGLIILAVLIAFAIEHFSKDDKTGKGVVREFIEDLKERR